MYTGDVGTEWAGWYPPYQLEGDDQVLNYVNYNHTFTESEGKARLVSQINLFVVVDKALLVVVGS